MYKSYQDAVNLLTSAGKFHISLGLDRITQILKLLDNPQDSLKCIHVAGTNGKGSVCSILSAILTASGKKIGLYTSPHIFKYTERIKISDNPISDSDFAEYVFDISKLADKNNIDLTEFEILTAVMFKYFADKKVDVAILETGLGGRFDATNVIKSNLCAIITHIDFDHTERLGKTIDKIAFEKSGIIKPNCPCIAAENFEVFKNIAAKNNSSLKIASEVKTADNFALKGVYQKQNLSLALNAINTVFPDIDKSAIDTGLKNVKHICRFQYIKDKNLIIDSAHNPNGIKALRQSLDFYYPDKKRRFIFGCLKNKDYPQMLQTLFKPDDEVYFYKFNNKNSCQTSDLRKVCPISSLELLDDTRINFNDGKLTVICGSMYMIVELTQKLDIRII